MEDSIGGVDLKRFSGKPASSPPYLGWGREEAFFSHKRSKEDEEQN